MSSVNGFYNHNRIHHTGRLSVALSLSLGNQLLLNSDFDGAKIAFESAFRSMTRSTSTSCDDFHKIKRAVEPQTISSTVETCDDSRLTTNQDRRIDTYLEDECDVGPRAFYEAVVPQDVLSLEVDVLHLIISFNQALVFHAKGSLVEATQLYKAVASTIGENTYSGPSQVILSYVGMRAHNNLGQIEYNKQSKEYAHVDFLNALSYARRVEAAGTMNNSSFQLERAHVLSNLCRTQWMLNQDADLVFYETLKEILSIRTTYLDQNHVDVAAADFNLGRAEFDRDSEKALKHFSQYIRISSERYSENQLNGSTNKQNENFVTGLELDPTQGLIYVLQIQEASNSDDMSQDLLWGLRRLEEKRQELGLVHMEVASLLNFVGTILFRRKQLEHALCFFAQELLVEEELNSRNESCEATSPNDDVSICVTCNNIGRILQELERYQEAKHYYHRSLSKNGTDTATAASTHFSSNHYADENSFFGNDNENSTKSKIPTAVMNLYSTVWYNLGLIHDKMGVVNEAIHAFRMSLKIRRAMLGQDHSDVSCLLYNIGVLQMEQNLLKEATESFHEALAQRQVSGKGQLDDHHIVKTLKKLSSMHKSKGDLKSALETNDSICSILLNSTDFKPCLCKRKMGATLRETADLYQARGDLFSALKKAVESANLFRSLRNSTNTDDMDIDNFNEENYEDKETTSLVEEEANALLLVGSLKHELCDSTSAQYAFSESARLLHSSLKRSTESASTLLPLLEVSAMLASGHCAAEA